MGCHCLLQGVHWYVDLSLGFLFCSIDLYFFVPVPHCLDDCGFVVEPEVRQVDSSHSILLSQDCFGYSRLFMDWKNQYCENEYTTQSNL